MAGIGTTGVRIDHPDGTTALRDLDLEVADGEFVAVIGPSGSGKTTLLRTIAGFLRPSAGEVRIDGRTVGGAGIDVPPEHRGLGMVFQEQALWPHWDVARNVGYPLRRAGVGREETGARVAEVLELVELTGVERRRPDSLSGGQRQRVALARALARRPGALLLDEALSALDEPLRAELRIRLKSLASSLGLTVLHVTHDRAEALALADRVVLLERGELRQVGTPDELVHAPADPFTAAFLSDAALVRGHLDDSGFASVDGAIRVPRSVIRAGAGSALSAGSSILALLPEGLEIVPGDDASVISAQFGRERHELAIDWRGTRLQASVSGVKPREGDRVGVRVVSAIAYPAD